MHGAETKCGDGDGRRSRNLSNQTSDYFSVSFLLEKGRRRTREGNDITFAVPSLYKNDLMRTLGVIADPRCSAACISSDVFLTRLTEVLGNKEPSGAITCRRTRDCLEIRTWLRLA